jgi:hypothetical protein
MYKEREMKKILYFLLLGGFVMAQLFAQSFNEQELPLKRVTLFSSGVAYFEHSGNVSGNAEISFPFALSEIDDALKSITINDPVSEFPSIQYPSEQTLYRTMNSLQVDLSGNPSIAQILTNLRGSEIKVFAPNEITGKIIGVEERPSLVVSARPGIENRNESYVSLWSEGSIRTIGIKEIRSFSFTDPKINDDLNRALEVMLQSRASNSRNLQVLLPANGSRESTISYVIPSPVWKVSYRLDLSADKPLIQGWAIIDNDGDRDWENVELTLVTGRPVSFIQNLYQPYHLYRPTLPIAIAGYAEAQTHDSGFGAQSEVMESAAEEDLYINYVTAEDSVMSSQSYARAAPAAPPKANLAGGVMNTSQAQAAGDHFAYTITKPVNLSRQQSVMVPLVDTTVDAIKSLLFSGNKVAYGGMINPSIAVELSNNTGMKLPAGPITVYDAGSYAGDALIEFFPDGAKRYITYGDDLSVTGTMSQSSYRNFDTVKISKGIMTIARKLVQEKTYTFVNNSGEEKRLVVEHPISGTTLVQPAQFSERTDSLYRFVTTLPKTGEFSFTVKEESPISEQVTLTQTRIETLMAYVSSGEIPAQVKTVLQRAIELRQQVDTARTALANMDSEKTRLISDQDRIRRNLEAVGPQSTQGQEYITRMTTIDANLDTLETRSATARKNVETAQKSYDDYVASISM